MLSLAGERHAERVGLDAFRVLATVTGFPADDAAGIVVDAAAELHRAWSDVRRPELFRELVEHIDERLAHHPLLS